MKPRTTQIISKIFFEVKVRQNKLNLNHCLLVTSQCLHLIRLVWRHQYEHFLEYLNHVWRFKTLLLCFVFFLLKSLFHRSQLFIIWSSNPQVSNHVGIRQAARTFLLKKEKHIFLVSSDPSQQKHIFHDLKTLHFIPRNHLKLLPIFN